MTDRGDVGKVMMPETRWGGAKLPTLSDPSILGFFVKKVLDQKDSSFLKKVAIMAD